MSDFRYLLWLLSRTALEQPCAPLRDPGPEIGKAVRPKRYRTCEASPRPSRRWAAQQHHGLSCVDSILGSDMAEVAQVTSRLSEKNNKSASSSRLQRTPTPYKTLNCWDIFRSGGRGGGGCLLFIEKPGKKKAKGENPLFFFQALSSALPCPCCPQSPALVHLMAAGLLRIRM